MRPGKRFGLYVIRLRLNPFRSRTTASASCYSTVQVLQLHETAKTAALTFHDMLSGFSYFGGNAEVLKNGDVEFCVNVTGLSCL